MDVDVPAAAVGVIDKNAAVMALCSIEENPEVVDDEISVVMEALEKRLWLPPSGEEEEEESEGQDHQKNDPKKNHFFLEFSLEEQLLRLG